MSQLSSDNLSSLFMWSCRGWEPTCWMPSLHLLTTCVGGHVSHFLKGVQEGSCCYHCCPKMQTDNKSMRSVSHQHMRGSKRTGISARDWKSPSKRENLAGYRQPSASRTLFFFLIGVQLLNNVVRVSAIQQHESVIGMCVCVYIFIYICVCVSPPSWTSLPPLPHPTTLGCHRARGWVPCIIQQLPISYLFCIR